MSREITKWMRVIEIQQRSPMSSAKDARARASARRIINFTLLKRNRRTRGVAKIGNESPPAKSDIAFSVIAYPLSRFLTNTKIALHYRFNLYAGRSNNSV